MDLTPNPIIVPMTVASNNQAVPMTVASNMQEVSLEPSAVVLPMPKKTSDLINDGEDGTSTYVESDELSDAAISGSYYDLRHKPSINGVELVGDKTFADLGLEIDETPTEDSENAASSGGVYDALEDKENVANKVTSIDPASTDAEYPSAKAVYDLVGGEKPYLKCVGYWYLLSPSRNHATLEIVNGTSLEEALKQPVQVYISMNDYPTPDYIGQSLLQINDYEDDYIVVFPQSIQWAAFLTKIKCGGAKFRYNSSTHLFTFKSLIEGTELKENKVQRIPEVDIDYNYASDQYPSIRAIRKMFDDLHTEMESEASATKTLVDLELDENGDLVPTFDDIAVNVPVQSVNGKTGAVILNASDVGALPNTTSIPSKTSDLTNDSDYITDAEMDAKLALKANSAGASANYAAKLSAAIPCGKLDSTSTATVMTATVPGITELKDGVCVFLQNGVITSASGFTLNINGLGAKPVYSSMAAATRVTTAWNVNYTMLFVYNEDRVEDGCWDMYYGIDNNTNTIGYQVRTNSQTMPMVGGVMYRYRLMFTAANGQGYIAANHSSSTNATAARTPATEKIDPHGSIFYYGTTAAVQAGSRPAAAYLWQQYALSLGYSFNNTGAALTLSTYDPVYVKCTPQSDGSAIIDPATPYVQQLPTSADGSIYIFLGVAYSATNIELETNHPVYYHDGDGIKLWTGERTLPKAPTVDGTYSLKCTVNNGVATYSWVND